SSGIGDYAIVPYSFATAAAFANYTVIESSRTLISSKRDLLISAADKTKVYGAGNPTFTGSISGVQNSDPISESFTTSADASSGIGDYAIVPHADARSEERRVGKESATRGTPTHTKRELLISAEDKTRVEGARNA